MTTQVKNAGKAHGAYVSTAVRQLKKSGLTGAALETAINAVKGQSGDTKLVKLPRKVANSICEQLQKHQRVVVINKGPKRFKVYSLDGYIASQKHSSRLAKENKPWEHAAKKRATSLIKEVNEKVVA